MFIGNETQARMLIGFFSGYIRHFQYRRENIHALGVFADLFHPIESLREFYNQWHMYNFLVQTCDVGPESILSKVFSVIGCYYYHGIIVKVPFFQKSYNLSQPAVRVSYFPIVKRLDICSFLII